MKTLDPVALTLAEALRDAPERETLLWGDIELVSSGIDATRVVSWDARADSHEGLSTTVTTIPSPGVEQRYVLRMPGDKALLDTMLDVSAARLMPGGELWIGGHKREGIRGVVDRIEARIGAVSVAHIKRHCRVLRATRGDSDKPPEPELAGLERSFPYKSMRSAS